MGAAADEPERLIVVGRVGKPHGLDGAFIVEQASDDPRRFQVGARVVVAGTETEILASRKVGKGRTAIRLERPAERGAALSVRRGDLPDAGHDTWYAFELEGLAVVDDEGGTLGRVVSVHPGLANDNIEVEGGLLLPLIDDAIVEVDPAGGRLVVRAAFLG